MRYTNENVKLLSNYFFAFTGDPSPKIRWLKDSYPLNNTVSNFVEKGSERYVQSTVIVKRLQRSDLHNQMTCEGRNNDIKPPLVATVQIDMNCKYDCIHFYYF